VFWAVTTRCDPATQTEILKDFPTSDINPRVAPEDRTQGRFIASRIVIDACRPYRWLKDFPPANVMSMERKNKIIEKWKDLLPGLR
jgi:4-hydroxy-3-polyprenylbenzoate decarboxylase